MTSQAEASSNDDAVQKRSALAEDADQPWWATDPAIIAARDGVDKWLESAAERPMPEDNLGVIHGEVMNGSCWRELRRARDDFGRARLRYDNAVRAARAVGFSWGEIGRILGVPRQLLHRRFRDEVD